MKKVIIKNYKMIILIIPVIIAIIGLIASQSRPSYAAETYLIGDYVYYNPFSNAKCSSAEYWTNYNQDAKCYRWL